MENTTGQEKFTGNYFEWIKDELTGIEGFAWGLLGFGCGLNVMTFAIGKIDWVAFITLLATCAGFFCTVMMGAGAWRTFKAKDGTLKQRRTVGHSINGLLGAISVVGYVIVNLYARHWWSIIDQLIFFSAIDIPLMLRWRTWGRGKDQIVRKSTIKTWLLTIVGILVSWAILYPIGVHLNDAQPFFDSLTLAIGATASLLYLKRYSGNYILWICSNMVNVGLWTSALVQGTSHQALPMLIMSLLYMVSSIYGKINFRISNNNRVRDIPVK